MSTAYYLTGEDSVKCGLNLRISLSVFVWVIFCSYLFVIAELFNIPLGGVHLKLLDVVSVLVLLVLLIIPSRSNIFLQPAVTGYRRLLYMFVVFLVISSLYGFVANEFPGGILMAVKVILQQVWPIIQVLLFFNLGLIFSRHLRFGENLFSGIVTFIALADILLNMGKLDMIQFLRPLVAQSMLFIFCYLMIFERLIGDRFDTRNIITPWLISILVLNFIAIMLSVTRTALGAVILGTTLMLIQKFWSKKIKLKYMLGAVIIVMMLVGISLKLGLADAFIYRTFNLEDSERIMIWLDAWRMFMDNPLMGVGTGYYINNSLITNIDLFGGLSERTSDIAAATVASAHNTFLYTLATTGITGFLIYLTVLWKTMRIITRQLQGVDWVKTFFFITFFLSLFEESTLFPSNRYTPLLLIVFWFFLGARLVTATRPEIRVVN